jgi:hypothetical protein
VLLKVKRSIELRSGKTAAEESNRCFADVLGYLRGLQNEFACNYTKVADSQRSWTQVCEHGQLPVLCDLTACGERFSRLLVKPLNRIAAKLLEHGVPEPDEELDDEAIDASVIDRKFDDQVERSLKRFSRTQRTIPGRQRHQLHCRSRSANGDRPTRV